MPSLDVQLERQRLLDEIEAAADAGYRSGAMNVVGTELRFYGVRVPDIRRIARCWQSAHAGVARADVIGLVEALWDGESQEERALAMELLGRHRQIIPTLEWRRLDRWRTRVDNWALADALAAGILSTWILAQPEVRLATLEALIRDPSVWSRRLALVATVPINRGHSGLTIPDLTLALVDRVKGERDPMLTKAVSWALRELTKTHPERVTIYLAENREQLAAHVVREVNNKLRTGTKSGRPNG